MIDLFTALGSDSIEKRVRALYEVQSRGTACLPELLEILDRPDVTMPARVWSLTAIGQLGPGVAERARDGVMRCLLADSPTVRRAALRTLGALRDVTAITAIARLTSDTTQDPSAWFDGDCTVGQTATLVLGELQALDNDRQ